MSNENQSFAEKREFFAWKPAAWLRVGGADSFAFLQGQFSNDLRGLESGGAVYGLWLNHKGRVLADSFVMRGAGGADEFWVGSYFSTAATIRGRLEAFIIADDVVVEDVTEQWTGVTWFGAEDAFAKGSDGFVFRGRRGVEPGWERVVPLGRADVADAGMSLTAVEMERRRIEAAIPAVPSDIGPGELPNEGGLEASAISYTKGCYLGQEVMARLKNLGQVRRRLLVVRGHGAPPVPLAALYQAEKKVGEIRTVATRADGFVALAMLSLINFTPTTGLSLEPAGPVVMTVDAHG